MTSPSSLTPGAVFARDYTIVRPLSEGGMGAVYVVQQMSTGTQRALKLMHAELVRDPKLRQRFEQEARVGSRIESEHVVQVLGAGIDEASGMPWLVMELLQGEDLSDVLARRGPLPPAEVREIFAQFTHAIAAAHRVGIVHRDLKPENIFVAVARREGASHLVKVLDFGIAKVMAEAKATATQALGTPIWMASEQTEPGRAIMPTADVWPLGLIAFKMLTGKHFWITANLDDTTSTMVLREVVFDPIPSASARAQEYGVAHLLPPGFDAWFSRCVVRETEARYPNADAARDAFFEMLGQGASQPARSGAFATGPTIAQSSTPAFAHTPVPAPTPATPYMPVAPFAAAPPPPPKKAPKGGSTGAILGVVGLVAVVGAGLGIRAFVRSQKVAACESSDGEDRLSACKIACDVDPQKFCVTHGDLSRAALTPASLEAASKSYDKACSAKDWLGCRKLGSIQEIEGNDAALASFEKSCEGKSQSGCSWLGRRIERGRGAPRDAAKALSYYEVACAGDDPASCALLGFASENRPLPRPGAEEIAGFHRKAASALQKECKAGGLAECLWLGASIQAGKGAATDAAAAGKLFKKACDGGLREACNNADALDLTGPDAAKSAARAVASLQSACSAGLAAACNNVAVVQANVPFALRQDQGVTLFRVTCSPGVSLGCTDNGPAIAPLAAIPKDVAGAVASLEKACTAGVGVACLNLGALQESGLQAPKDTAKALSSYEKACAAGAPDGCSTMKEPPFRPGDVWTGKYVCGQGTTDLWLRILEPSADQRVSAIFEFSYGPSKSAGRFLVSGAYAAAQRSIPLSPGIWIEQPPNYQTVGLRGTVSIHGTIFEGKIDNPSCGAFRVVRSTSDMIDPHCAAGARFVEGHGCVPVPQAGPTAIGTWNGKGTEANGSTWPITATIKSLESGRCGQVTYPSLSCTGDWYCVKSSDGKQIRAREIITTGHARCDATGFIDMTLADDGQSASWRWSSPIRASGSTAALTRSSTP